MKTKTKFLLVLALAGGVWGAESAFGSGSYGGRPPKPPTSAVDSGQYNLGKDIYSGKANLGQASATTATSQSARLKDLQAKLPKSAQKTVNLPELAGKLDAAQLSALEYYLEVRYQVK